MNIPDEVIEAAAKAGYEQKMNAPWERGFSAVKNMHRQEAAAAAPVIAEWARKEALREAAALSENAISPGPGDWNDGWNDCARFLLGEMRRIAEGVSDGQQ